MCNESAAMKKTVHNNLKATAKHVLGKSWPYCYKSKGKDASWGPQGSVLSPVFKADSPQVTTDKSSGWLLLLSARPAVTFPASMSLAGSNLLCLVNRGKCINDLPKQTVYQWNDRGSKQQSSHRCSNVLPILHNQATPYYYMTVYRRFPESQFPRKTFPGTALSQNGRFPDFGNGSRPNAR